VERTLTKLVHHLYCGRFHNPRTGRSLMDAATARDMIEDLQLEIAELRERIRQLEAERDQWQTRAVSNG